MASIHVVVRGAAAEPLTKMALASLRATAAQRAIHLTIDVVTHGSLGDFVGREPARSSAGLVYVSDPSVTAPMNKKVVVATRADAVRHAHALLDQLVPREPAAEPEAANPPPSSVAPSVILAPPSRPSASAAPSRGRSAYRHLLAGAAHALPILVVGCVALAIAFALEGAQLGERKGTVGWGFLQIAWTLQLVVPVLAAFIASSIAARQGLTAGFIGGSLASIVGAGVVGGVVAGFLAGYLTRWLDDVITPQEGLQRVKRVLIVPLLSSLAVGATVIFLIGPPMKVVIAAITSSVAVVHPESALLIARLFGG